MRYPGSKRRISNGIIGVIMQNATPDTVYVEPFCGGCNMLTEINLKHRYANDINSYWIAMITSFLGGWRPPTTISKDAYLHIRDNKSLYPPELVGFAGVFCSFGAKWFGGFAVGDHANYALRGLKALTEAAKYLRGVHFTSVSYDEMEIPDRSIVYCDPPYSGVSDCLYCCPKFDHDQFWQWAADLSNRADVVVSEYSAPVDWRSLGSISTTQAMCRDAVTSRVEQLFVHESNWRLK
jgi:DNA adenine methylase